MIWMESTNEMINILINDDIRLNEMSENSIKLGKTDATDKIYKILLELRK